MREANRGEWWSSEEAVLHSNPQGEEAERNKTPPIFIYYEQACTNMVQANRYIWNNNLERIKSDYVTYCESLSEQFCFMTKGGKRGYNFSPGSYQ